MEGVFHHAGHISFMVEEEGSRGKKKTLSQQWPCHLLAGPLHTRLSKVSPLIYHNKTFNLDVFVSLSK